jgi:hypothetical protein
MNTSDPVWMTKAQLKTRTGEVDWDKLLQKFKKYSSKQTRGGYRVGCNGDPNCPECLSIKTAINMSPCADPHGDPDVLAYVILHVLLHVTTHVFNNVSA